MTDHGSDGRFIEGNYPERPFLWKLTQECHDRIVELVGHGNYLSTAARATGLHPRTLKGWLQRGEADHEAGKSSPHAALFRDVREAAAVSEAKLVEMVKLAGVEGFQSRRVHRTTKKDGGGNTTEVHEHEELTEIPPDWRAAARLLESRAQSRFGLKHRIEGRHAHAHAHLHGRAEIQLTEEDRASAARILQRECERIAEESKIPTDLALECFEALYGWPKPGAGEPVILHKRIQAMMALIRASNGQAVLPPAAPANEAEAPPEAASTDRPD